MFGQMSATFSSTESSTSGCERFSVAITTPLVAEHVSVRLVRSRRTLDAQARRALPDGRQRVLDLDELACDAQSRSWWGAGAPFGAKVVSEKLCAVKSARASASRTSSWTSSRWP